MGGHQMGKQHPHKQQNREVRGKPQNLCLFLLTIVEFIGNLEGGNKNIGFGMAEAEPHQTPKRTLWGPGKSQQRSLGGSLTPRPEMSLSRPKGKGPTGWDPWQSLWVSISLTLAPVSSTELFPVRETGRNERNWGLVSWVLRREEGRGPGFLGLGEQGRGMVS